MGRTEKIAEIPKAKYVGYIWYSDSKRPEVLTGDKEYGGFTPDAAANPFIIEGNLWDDDNRTSISIRYADGRYYIHRTVLTSEEVKGTTDHSTVKTYVAHHIDGYKYLRFAQLWEPRTDPMCEGMEVLEPSKLVFIGFTNDK